MGILLFVFKLFPTVLGIVQAIESALPIPGAGKAKLDLVLNTVSDVYDTEQTVQKELPKDKLFQIVTSLIQRTVAAFNSLGVFKKTATAVTK